MYIQREVENMNELLDKATIMENMLYKISQDVNAMQYLLEDLKEILLMNPKDKHDIQRIKTAFPRARALANALDCTILDVDQMLRDNSFTPYANE